MAKAIIQSIFSRQLKGIHHLGVNHQSRRWQSSMPTFTASPSREVIADGFTRPVEKFTFPLSRLSTNSMLRCLLLSTIFSHPALFRPGFAVLRTIANSKSIFLNPDKNPVLRAILKPLIYDQFCAGTNRTEVQNTVADIKRLGYSGIILCYGKEVVVDQKAKTLGSSNYDQTGEIKQWKDGNLQTLSMAGEGDWLGIKLTGAGQSITEALLNGSTAPSAFLEAMDAICERALLQGCRIWIDAEQQAVQHAIDIWTIDLMRRWNKRPHPLIYNTVQAYLKESRNKLEYQLRLAQDEGWTLGVKLVRGAYISNDIRDRIHDTKSDTDASYEGIVKDLLQGTFPGFSAGNSPKLALFLAGHNSNTIRMANTLARQLSDKGQLKVSPEFGQLHGMADDIGCELLQCAENLRVGVQDVPAPRGEYVPRVYKCLTWGTLQECMQYLVRRTVENQGAAERMKDGSSGFAKEIRRRLWDGIWRRSSTNTV